MKRKSIHPIVENINKLLKDRQMSKTQFALRCGIPESKWNKISNGAQELSLWDFSKIAESFEMSLIDLIGYPHTYVRKKDSEIEEKVSVTFEVSPENRDVLLNMITKMKR